MARASPTPADMITPLFKWLTLPLGFALALSSSALAQFASPHEKKLGKSAPPTHVARLMENLDRGVVAVNKGGGKIFVSWRLLGTEAPDIAFNIYRTTGSAAAVKLNAAPLTQGTNFVDSGVDSTQTVAYTVRAVTAAREEAASRPFTFAANAPARPYLSIPLHKIEGYVPTDISPADLDGDGEYELIVHQASRGRDNSQPGFTGSPILQAYKLDGRMLWQIDLGKNIREGSHYTQFMVYDLDGDGRAELVCKTGDGTTDALGKVIGDPQADWRSPQGSFVPVRPGEPSKGHVMRDGILSHETSGNVLKGPEYLTVFDGLTGAAIDTVNYEPQRHPTAGPFPTPEQLNDVWGDAYGNRMDRLLACVAYFDGEHPSVMFSRGYYTRTVLAAWDFKDKKLVKRWIFDTANGARGFMYYEHQGNHSLTATDVDGDGRDEIVFGSAVIDDDGMGLYSTQLNHGDAQHVSDLDPTRPGMEILSVHEFNQHFYGLEMRDAATGEILWGKRSYDPARCLAIDIDPRYPGAECWGVGENLNGLYSAQGKEIAQSKPRSCSFGILWDGDLLSEILNGNQIEKWNWEKAVESTIFTMEGASNSTALNGGLTADILGDWREEQVVRTADSSELRIYTTTIPTTHRLYTLMHDPQYRLSVALQNVAYNQPPHTSYFLGDGMAAIKQPNIKVVPRR
jgi:rhamnogalacturonan endolyase